MDDFYSLQNDDIKFVQGDTVNLEYEFVDENEGDIDISGYDCKFTVRSPETGNIIPMLLGVTDFSKEHNDAVMFGRGIYFRNDVEIIGTGLSIAKTNQLVIVLDSIDTVQLEYGMVYPFDIQLSLYNKVITAVRGSLLIAKEQTPS